MTSSGLNSQAQLSTTQALADQAPTEYQQLMYRPDTPMSLEELPSSYWTVQLIALSSARELQGFMSTLQLDGLIGAMIKTNNKTFYVALLGVYETRTAAQLAANERPESLSRYQPYVRSLGSLQAAMARASQLPR
jgi:DamX protein